MASAGQRFAAVAVLHKVLWHCLFLCVLGFITCVPSCRMRCFVASVCTAGFSSIHKMA